MELLDELAFEQQGFRLAADDVEIEVVDRLDQGLEFQVPAEPARGLKIMAHAFAQIAGLADVDHRAETVAHQVDARLVRQGAYLFADVFGD